ncbi:carboxylesterase type B, partial [Setomelanomma holmii]
VDLGYETYRGVVNESTGLNVFKGIRFAAPPIGSLRWQASQPPVGNAEGVTEADKFGPACPHSLRSGQDGRAFPSPISEDCLFLNVYAPQNASGLPVLFMIHGGGYGVGDGREDLSNLINANDNTFIGVSIQYRLGAFGFLAGDEVFRNGKVNAGILDQQAAAQWVQNHIEKFGGDPRQVTIFGISAGGGSVMLHDTAYGGTLGTSFFANSIAFSPYLPQQYAYNDWIPSQAYYAFASQAGCAAAWAHRNSSETTFQCLVSKDSETLQAASNAVSSSGAFGTWAFLPVTDGVVIKSTPSEALSKGKINGQNHLTSNVAEESFAFVPQEIKSKQDLQSWIDLVFPLFNRSNVDDLLSRYSTPDAQNELPKQATSGNTGATALECSALATGYQQIANLIYAESTFVCPSYWLAEAYNAGDKKGYKMQYSVPIALHGYDGIALFGNTKLPNQGADLVKAIQAIVGSFVTTGTPFIALDIAVLKYGGTKDLPAFTAPVYAMLNLNQTGGQEVPVNSTLDPRLNDVGASWYVEPDLRNAFSVVNGWEWEGGRGDRCEYWREIAAKVP